MHCMKAIERFMEHLLANERSPHTVSSYQRDLHTFAKWLKAERLPGDVRKLTPEIVNRFFTSDLAIRRLDGQPKRPASVNKLKLTLKSFFCFLEQAWLIQKSPARVLRCKRERRAVTNIITLKEKKKLLAAARASKKSRAKRDFMILDLFLSTGIRIDSLIHLDIDDINLSKKTMLLRKMKGGAQATKILNRHLLSKLKSYLGFRRRQAASTDALFISNRGTRISRRQVHFVVTDWAAAAGLEKNISSRTFRHSFASELYSKTLDLVLVKEALDHSSVTVSEIYTHVACL